MGTITRDILAPNNATFFLPWHSDELGDVMHCCDGQPSSVLPLRLVQQRDDGGALVAVRVDGHDGLGARLVLLAEGERRVLVVLGGVAVDEDAAAARGAGGGVHGGPGRPRRGGQAAKAPPQHCQSEIWQKMRNNFVTR